MYQAIPALYELYKRTGGAIVTTRLSTFIKTKRNFPEADVRLVKDYLPKWWPSKKLLHEAKLIVTGAPYRSFLAQFSAKKAMIFHGTYVHANDEELLRLKHFDFLFSFGKRMTEYLSKGGYQKKIIESGYIPFLSFKHLSTAQKEVIYKKLHLSPSKQTILYMPMGKSFSSWDIMAEKLVSETPKEFNLILRPHPSYNTTINLVQTFKLIKLRLLCRKRGNTFLDKSNLSQGEIFNLTDLLICDGASVPEEALFYKIPIIFVETDRASKVKFREHMQKNNLNERYIKRVLSIYDCGVSITPDESVAKKIKLALSQDKTEAQESYFKWVFNGRSKDRQLEATRFILNHISRKDPD